MTTFQDLIEETRHHLMTGQQDKINTLAVLVNDSTDTIPLTYELRGIAPGVTLSCELEEMHVVDAGSTLPGSSCTVIRGVNGSTPAEHAANTIVRLGAQFTDYRIGKYVNEALDDISAEGLFRIDSVEFDYNPSQQGYNLIAPGLIDIWRIKYKTPGPAKNWPVIPAEMWQIDRDASTTDFANGVQLLIQDGGYSGHPIRVSYRRGYDHLTLAADDVLVVSHLHNEAHSIPPLGAAITLLGGREVKRSFLNRQPEPRRQQEVPPGAANQAMLPLVKRYEDRIRKEKRRLRRLYPGAY
jgi:hypothetical protein